MSGARSVRRGSFVVLEGGEGSGKTTQLARVGARLRARGHDVVETFEPGGTARGRDIRALLLDGDEPLDSRAELLLLAADRAQHVNEVIEPALARGADVVCDRFTPSTLAYQGHARGLDVEEIARISAWAARDVEPDVVVVLDVPESVAHDRGASGRDRFERAGAEFHAAVRAAYLELAPVHHWVVVDGRGAPDEVESRVWEAVEPRLRRR
jgi:dTMP kinase